MTIVELNDPSVRVDTELSMEFDGLSIAYGLDVLAPRPWTVAQSRWAFELLRDRPVGPFAELCAGVGHIGLAAARGARRTIVQADRSDVACGFARRNARAAGVAAEVRCASLSDAFEPGERFGLILADPPYIPSAELDAFPDDPLVAIDGGTDGLHVAEICLTVAGLHLDDDGLLLLQLRDSGQARRLSEPASRCGLRLVDERVVPSGGLVALFRRAEPR